MPEASISCPGRAKVRKPPTLMASVENMHASCLHAVYVSRLGVYIHRQILGQLIRPGDGPSRAHCGDSCKQSIQAVLEHEVAILYPD